ncbi:MAG: glycosyltransferase family 4 protein, partial [Hyphomicrobiales bacterium]|nr:glycosyltransferase family 4 protein [Hyphomicrobiales bacterium]
VHNGLKDEEFAPVAATDGGFDFVFVGELRQLKGVDVLIDAFSRLRRADGRPIRLNIVGGGAEEAAFRDQVDRFGLADRVVFSGVQPARTAFTSAACVVLPSRKESLPYIVLEAAACGLPVIATRVGGIAEIYGPTADQLIPADDADALAGAMQRVLDDPAAAASEAADRRAFVQEHFVLPKMINGIESLYRDALAARRA